jgi:hypothetical protein
MLRIFSKAAKKIAVGAEGMNRKREAETKKACRLGKPLMFSTSAIRCDEVLGCGGRI